MTPNVANDAVIMPVTMPLTVAVAGIAVTVGPVIVFSPQTHVAGAIALLMASMMVSIVIGLLTVGIVGIAATLAIAISVAVILVAVMSVAAVNLLKKFMTVQYLQ